MNFSTEILKINCVNFALKSVLRNVKNYQNYRIYFFLIYKYETPVQILKGKRRMFHEDAAIHSCRLSNKKFSFLGRDAWENGLGYNYWIPLDGCRTQGPRVSLVWTLLNLYNACVRRMDHPCREVSLDAASSTLRSRARTKYSIGPSSRLDSIPGRIWHQVREPAFSSGI